MTTITQFAIGIFVVLHGAVHVWYVVLSQGWVEYEDAMGWNGRSWLLSRTLDEDLVLDVGSVLYVLVAIGFAVGGTGYVLSRSWWVMIVGGSAAVSTIVIVTLWDGQASQLVENGAVGVLINVGLLVWILALR